VSNALCFFLWAFCIVLGFCVLALSKKAKSLEEQLQSLAIFTDTLWRDYKAEKTVENITDGVEA